MEDNIPVSELSYKEAVAQLDSIISEIQGDKCDIDKLAALTRRAKDLLEACEKKLTATEDELNGILESLNKN